MIRHSASLIPALRAHSWLWRYPLAVVAVVLAFAFRENLLPGAGDRSPFQTFVLAVLASALIGGLGPGLFATGLGACLAAYFYLPPFFALAVGGPEDVVRVALFLATGAAVALAGGLLRRAIRREQMLSRGSARFARFLRHAAVAESLQGPGAGVPVERLSERELEVVRLLTLGMSNEEIAAAMFVSRNTVKTHLAHVYGKLGVRTRTAAVARCIELGWLVGDSHEVAHPAEGPIVGESEPTT